MKTTKVSINDIKEKHVIDRTNWAKLISKSQDLIDKEAHKDQENPIMRRVLFKPFHKTP